MSTEDGRPLNAFLSALAEACRSRPLDAKILLTPSRQAGLQACEALALAGVQWVNLRAMTPGDLALEVIGNTYESSRCNVVSDSVCRALMLKVVLEMSSSGWLSAFGPLAATPSTGPALADMVFRSVRDLFMAGLDPAEVDTPVRDAARFYAAELHSRGWVDYPGLLRRATNLLRAAGELNMTGGLPVTSEPTRAGGDCGAPYPLATGRVLFLMPSSAVFEPLEWGFIRAASRDSVQALPCDEADELAVITGHTRLRLFTAAGTTNELREVFRRVVTSGAPADSVEIVYTSADYIPTIYSLGKQHGLPVTFADGIPAYLVGPGRALLGYLEWLSNDFLAASLRRLLVSGDMALPSLGCQSVPGVPRLSRILAKSGIGWGRDRYRPCLDSLATEYEQAGSDSARRDAAAARYLADLAGLLIDVTPRLSGDVDMASLARGCAAFVASCTRDAEGEDRECRHALLQELEDRAAVTGIRLPTADALRHTREWLLGLKVAARTPRPGRIHASGYASGGISGRAHTFVVGLDAARFPGTVIQDPILPDGVRAALSPDLSLAADRPGKNTRYMASILAGVRGDLTLSYSCYDVADGRACSPAALLLEVHRAATGRHDDDYTALTGALRPPSGFEAAEGQVALTSAEWWLQTLAENESFRRAIPLVAGEYPGIRRGLEAQEARSSDGVTEFEGFTGIPFNLSIDGACISATSLEDLGRCPFAFFLKHVLRVRPLQELVYSPLRWLDPASRGELLHRVFREVLEGISRRGESVEWSRHRSESVEVAERLIEEYARAIPAPSEAVLDQERREIISAVDILLKMEEESADETAPVHFELAFGTGCADTEPPGSPEPVEIPMENGGTVALQGRVDRVDRVKSAEPCPQYVVWDYKTGSSRKYEDNSPLCGGRRVQHALYAAAVEKLLRRFDDPRARVVRSGYLFPTERGEGRRLAYDAVHHAKLGGLLGAAAELLASGAFTPTDDGETCQRCEYTIVCDGTGDPGHIRRKMQTSPMLAPLRRLRSYE